MDDMLGALALCFGPSGLYRSILGSVSRELLTALDLVDPATALVNCMDPTSRHAASSSMTA